ncbi:MAG: SPASM domain-containing protein [Brevinema sp.]
MLFVLIDTISKEFSQTYSFELQKIHQILCEKLSTYDTIVIGSEDSLVAKYKFKNAKSAYYFLSKKNQDLILIDAYAAFLSLKDTHRIYEYTKKGLYDICLIENLPHGIVPYVIDQEFIQDLPDFIDEETPLSSQINDLINWEYQGIDVGVFLSHSQTILRRIDFTPTNKHAINYMLDLAKDADLSLDNLEYFIDQHPILLRPAPAYVAIELSPKTDHFYARDFSSKSEMSLSLFQKIITECDQISPEAVLSLGVFGDPFAHKDFGVLFDFLVAQNNNRTVYVETKALVLDESFCAKVLNRPHTELIFDLTFTTDSAFNEYKSHPHTLSEIKTFIRSLPHQNHIWIRLVRAPESESHIKNFLKEWEDFHPRIIITKTDSIMGGKVVDLSPIKRHSCLALRREMTFLSDGTMLRCRQSSLDEAVGSVVNQSIQQLWDQNHPYFSDQEKGKFDSCAFCQQCDDWWLWN